MQAVALNAWSAQLTWTAPLGTTRVQVFRQGRLLDDFSFASGGLLVYTDYLLWHSTGYTYEVKAFNSSGAVIGDQSKGLTTPAQSGSFPRFYSATSFWNQPIAASPAIDPNSAAMVKAALSNYAGSANFGANSDAWGIPVAYSNGVDKVYTVGCTRYGCNVPVTFKFARYATPNTGSDHHLAVVNLADNSELDMWIASYSSSTDTWTAGSRYLTSAAGWGAECALGQHCDGGTASGFAVLGGVVRPEEIAQGHIDHALAITTPYTRSGYIACPATHTDGVSSDPAALPEGAHIQLDPSFNVDAQSWPQWEKVIAHALQKYGAYVNDTGGSVAIAAEANLDRGYNAWNLAGVSGTIPSLSNLPWSQFRVLQLTQC